MSRGCWLLPNGCKNSSDCSAAITWKHTGRSLLIEMEAKLKVVDNGLWLAVGISKDDIMGDDTVFECHFPRKGRAAVHLSHNLQLTNLMLPAATATLLRDSYAEERDGRVMCGAELMLDFTVLEPSEKKMMHQISSGEYHLMLAFGDLDAESVKKSHALVGEGAPWRSSERTRFCNHCPPHIVDE
ncbi:unnamed protein product [Haemonchus placei]|uniref:DOMON domain-containing protein n=1 Tax=Haemonchus placei TaxID=6290 RepID=A0A0N4XAA9_HAEPC|nr:unnamed protein product [Haemonchus placei]